MAPFGDVSEIESTLNSLRTRDDGPFVVRLARQPGRRDSQYAHLFSGAIAEAPEEPLAVAPSASSSGAAASSAVSSGASVSAASPSRIDRLEAEVKQLRSELDDLKQRLGV